MVYDCILVDVFSVYFKKQAAAISKDNIDLANAIISYIENDLFNFLEKENGRLYLLFDPIPQTDLGLSSCFKTTRQKIVKDYKSNRERNKKVLIVVDLIRKYFLCRNDQIKVVISKEFEADDFVEGLINQQPENSKIAMITSDEDWCRYLSSTSVIINNGFNDPYTRETFWEKYHFIPTVATVTLFKSVFGDSSDNIPNIFVHKKIPNVNRLKKSFFEWIQFIGDQNEKFEDLYKRIKSYTFLNLHRKEEMNSEEKLFFQLLCLNPKKDVLSTLWSNIEVVRCRCQRVDQYIVNNSYNKKFDNLILSVLKRNDIQNKKFKFGNIRTK